MRSHQICWTEKDRMFCFFPWVADICLSMIYFCHPWRWLPRIAVSVSWWWDNPISFCCWGIQPVQLFTSILNFYSISRHGLQAKELNEKCSTAHHDVSAYCHTNRFFSDTIYIPMYKYKLKFSQRNLRICVLLTPARTNKEKGHIIREAQIFYKKNFAWLHTTRSKLLIWHIHHHHW